MYKGEMIQLTPATERAGIVSQTQPGSGQIGTETKLINTEHSGMHRRGMIRINWRCHEYGLMSSF